MKFSQGIFAIKLYELEQQYGHMQSRLRLCQQADQPKIRQELQRTEDEYRENELLLQENVKGSRSPAVAALADAQLHYFETVKRILEQDLPDYLHCESSSAAEDNAEALALYAEYAIDYAAQSMRYALIVALKAIDLQISSEKREETNNEAK